MPKVKQKISGGFQNQERRRYLLYIRSYLATMHKQGANLFHALTLTFQASPLSLDSLELRRCRQDLSSYVCVSDCLADYEHSCLMQVLPLICLCLL